jgi:hypothetical protein
MNLLLFFLPAIIAFGAITSYEDYRRKKIRNKWIALALMCAIFMLAAITLLLHYQGAAVKADYFSEYLFNLGFSLFAGLVIWFCGMWTAGDAKLFLAYAALVPLSVYKWGYVTHFPAFAILVNTFAPFFLYHTARMVFERSAKDKLQILREILNPKMFLHFVLFVFAFYWLLLYLVNYAPPQYVPILTNLFVSTVILFLILLFFQRVVALDYLYIAAVVSVLAIILDYKKIFTLSFVENFVLILFLFVFIVYFVVHLAYRRFSTPIYIENLKKGMIPAENFVQQKGKYSKRRMAQISFVSGLLEKTQGTPLFKDMARGMTENEVTELKRLHSQGSIAEHTVRVYPAMSFAPFMFAGVLITVLCSGDVFVFARIVMEKFI